MELDGRRLESGRGREGFFSNFLFSLPLSQSPIPSQSNPAPPLLPPSISSSSLGIYLVHIAYAITNDYVHTIIPSTPLYFISTHLGLKKL